MVYIAPGHFTMGTNNQAPALAAANPAHDVEVTKGFCIDRAEVTVEAYNQCAGTTRCSQASSQAAWARDDRSEKAWEASLILHAKQCNAAAADRWSHPVNCVSWYQAKTYCEALGRRLPTEAEWEFTARGPSDRAFPWGDGAPKPQLLNACGKECRDWHETVGLSNEAGATLYEIADGFAATSPVGAFGLGATPEGVLDLAGNVFEWTLDGASEYSTTATDASKPSGERHMIRGGAYNSGNIESIDPTFRFAMPDATLSPAIGFRCASSP
jgi:formylglycine-generating enzyme required for sulfatase activity